MALVTFRLSIFTKILLGISAAAALPLLVHANPLGFDTGWSPERTEATVSVLGDAESVGTWLRVRGMVNSEVWRSDDGVAHAPWSGATVGTPLVERRAALSRLRMSGHEIVAMLRWSTSSWQHGTRPIRSQLPIDLTEAFERCRDLARTYGDLVTVWEIENEPDISFVPENAETFAAFHKACALGIIAGRAENMELSEKFRSHTKASAKMMADESANEKTDTPNVAEDPISDFQLSGFNISGTRAASAIMHSPLALPPGPYWNQLVENDILPYTEAFNYHYYGFPEDFRGVRDWWINALNKASLKNTDPWETDSNFRISASQYFNILHGRPALPLFLTEYGYGPLDRFDRFTIEGRERQKRFFETALPSITDGSISGAMAFVFMPYYEHGRNEFGLLAEAEPQAEPSERQNVDVPSGAEKSERPEFSPPPKASPPDLPTSPPSHSTSNPPSLPPTFPLIDTTGLSPVVLDFSAQENFLSVKRYSGHMMTQWKPYIRFLGHETAQPSESNPAEEQWTDNPLTSSGNFDLALYNLSGQAISGTLRLTLESGAIRDRIQPPPIEKNPVIPQPVEKVAPDTTHATQPAPLPPYRRPEFPRSSIRPPETVDWPTPNTPRFTAKDGRGRGYEN
jgi:hypothetical protein